MDALLICGGPGRRLGEGEKPLFPVAGRPMVDWVVDAVEESRIDSAYAVLSPHVPETSAHLDLPKIETPGAGYVADLQQALDDDRIDPPVLTAAADLPLLSAGRVDWLLDRYRDGSTTVCVPVVLKRLLGVSVDPPWDGEAVEVVPAGLNVVSRAGPESTLTSWDARLAVNVNRPEDAAVAEALA